ncbi:MAG: MMPL family transporter [Bacteroidia bacterium]|nr:MMPL family transporter [Bacteroidia bacterium]
MQSIYLKYLDYTSRKPWFLALVVIAILLLSFPVLQTNVNNNMEEWFPSDSPQLIAKNQFIKDFGNDELIFVLLTFPENFPDSTKRASLEKLADEFGKINGLDQVLYRNQLQINGLPGLGGRIRRLEKLFFEAKNPNTEMVYLRPVLKEEFDKYRPVLLDSVNASFRVLDEKIKVNLTGSGVVFTRIEELTNRDSGLLFGLCFALIFLILGFRLRKVKKMGISLGLFFLLFIPAFSLFGWLGISVSLITMVVPLLLIINFFAYLLHLNHRGQADKKEYVLTKLAPIIYSALTTMIGFGSLMLSKIQVIQHFGLLTFGGIMIGLLVLLLAGIPILLIISSPESPKSQESQLFDNYLNSLNTTRSWGLVLFALTIIGMGIFWGQKIDVDTNSVNFLPPQDSLRLSTNYIQSEFGAFNTVDFLVAKSDSSPISNKDFRKLSEIEKRVGELPQVNGVIGFNAWRSILRMAANTDPTLASSIEETYLTHDKRRSRLSMRIPLGSVQSMKADLEIIEGIIQEELVGSRLEMKAVGYLPIYIEHVDLIVDGMTKSLAWAILLIAFSMILMVGDIKLGLVALIPNTFPVFGLAIFMHLAQIPLDIATSIIGSVVIGLVVDDTLHIIWNFKKERKKGQPMMLSKVFQNILYPSTSTSIMFATGFLVLIASGIGSLKVFGQLVSLAIVLGWAGDFIIFPAFLYLLGKGKNQDSKG